MAVVKKIAELLPEPEAENTTEHLTRIKNGDSDPLPYDRMMIYYRKEKKYKEELALIKKAISFFQKRLDSHRPLLLKKKNAKSASVELLSKKIALQTGLVDKKGKQAYVPEPIARWMKRQATVEKKLST